MALPLIAARLGSSFLGRSLLRGASEAVGFGFSGGKATGFLGLGKQPLRRLSRLPGITARVAQRQGLGRAAMFAGGRAMGGLGLAFTGISMYQGYQEEGVWGAAKAGAESVALGAAWHAAAGLVGNPVVLGVAAVAGMGYGYYRFGEAAQAHRKRIRGVEMGTGTSMDVIGSAGALTERARAMNALYSTHINARMALGNEALLSHNSYR